MGENSNIEWCKHSQNWWVGCEKVSAGCKFCYMFSDMKRYGQDPRTIRRTSAALWRKPLKWNREAEAAGERAAVFTCSWSDFFIEQADPWRAEAWEIMERCEWLDWQVLTKRAGLMNYWVSAEAPDTPPNIWLGVSVENRKQGLPRIDILRNTPAKIRFLSIEPLLEDLGVIDLTGIDWLIIGGESGPGARPFNLAWALAIIEQCRAAGVPCFVKQAGSNPVWGQHGDSVRHMMSDRKGGNPSDWPAWMRVREMPRGAENEIPA